MKYDMYLAPGDEIIIEFSDGSTHEVCIRHHEGNGGTIAPIVEVNHLADAGRGDERLTYWFNPNV